MTNAEIITLVRRLIKEPTTRRVTDAEITAAYLRGVLEIGNLLKLDNPDYFAKREGLTSGTNVFAWPTGCVTILGVWDLEDTMTSISAVADNGSGKVRVTATSHGISDGAIVCVQGTWSGTYAATYVDANTLDLAALTYVAATHTSGGYIWAIPDDLRSKKMTKIGANEADGGSDRAYYFRGRNIVVDDLDFEDDIIVDYYYNPTTLSEIPEEYHDQGLVSFAVLATIMVPPQTDPNFQDLLETKRSRQKMWDSMPDMISGTIIPVQEAVNIDDTLEDSDKYIQ